MPPKNNSKGKKGIPPTPQKSSRADRRREQEKKADAKKLSRSLKKFKKDRKQNKKSISSPNNYDENNPETLQHETSGEEGEIEDINLPHSSGTEPSSSRALEKQVTQQKSNIKESKNTNLPYYSCKEPSTSRALEKQVTQQKGNIKESKNTKLPHYSSKEPSTSRIGYQVNQQNDSNKASKKTGNDHAPLKEKSLIKPKYLVLKIPKNITESTKLSSNIDNIEQCLSRSILLNYSDDNKLHKGEQAKMQEEAANKEIAEKETLKPTESIDFASNTSKNVPPKVHIKKTEDLTKKWNILQQKQKTFKTDMKSLDEQEKKPLPSVKETKSVISGEIKVVATNKMNSDKKCLTYSYYMPYKRMIYMGDGNIEISLQVNQGSQVVCNSRRRPVIDLFQDVKSCSGSLEGHATPRPDEDIKTVSERYDKTTSDTKCESSSVSGFSSSYCQIGDDQTTDNPGTGTLVDSEQHDTTATNTKCNSSSISKFYKENDSSGITSVQEKVRNLCNNYFKDFTTVCKKFEARVENHIKGDSLKSSEI